MVNEMSLVIDRLGHQYPAVDGTAKAVLAEISLTLVPGEQLLLRGVSGSGKTTLINILAGLLTPTAGTVTLAGQSLYALGEAARDRFRRDHIGYVFQTHNLVPLLSAWENAALPLAFAGVARGERRARAQSLLEALGLGERVNYRPNQLSNGQRQRVAIARALITEPHLVLADEPTASLDADAAAEAIDLLQTLCRERDAMLIVASHDPALAPRFGRSADLDYGRLIFDGAPLATASLPH